MSRQMYVAAIERLEGKGRHQRWIPDGFLHTHANDRAHARMIILQALRGNTRRRIVDVALNIGYHVLDKKGEILST